MQVMLSNLPPADCARLQAFLRVGSDRLRSRWSIGSGEQVGLLLFSGETPETIPGHLDATPRLVRVVEHGEAPPDDGPVLTRPIDFETFITLMVAAEAALHAPAQAEPAPAPQPVPAMPAAMPTAPDPQGGAAAAPTRQAVSLDDPVRLKRWPQASLLQDWRYGIRMSSFMSTRFVTVRELARLSNVSEPDCARFVDALHAAGLIRHRDELAAVAPAPRGPDRAAPGNEPAAAPPATTARLGLLGRLRQKLGLGQRGPST